MPNLHAHSHISSGSPYNLLWQGLASFLLHADDESKRKSDEKREIKLTNGEDLDVFQETAMLKPPGKAVAMRPRSQLAEHMCVECRPFWPCGQLVSSHTRWLMVHETDVYVLPNCRRPCMTVRLRSLRDAWLKLHTWDATQVAGERSRGTKTRHTSGSP